VRQGTSDDPFTANEIAEKFISSARTAGWNDEDARRFADYVLVLDQQNDLELLFARLARGKDMSGKQ
jgi:hypothetical protein